MVRYVNASKHICSAVDISKDDFLAGNILICKNCLKDCEAEYGKNPRVIDEIPQMLLDDILDRPWDYTHDEELECGVCHKKFDVADLCYIYEK